MEDNKELTDKELEKEQELINQAEESGVQVNNHVPPTHKAPVHVIVAGTTSTEFSKPHILNGFLDEDHNYNGSLEGIVDKKKVAGESNMELMWNKADEQLYAVNRFVVGYPLDDKQLEEIAKSVQRQWSDGAGKEFEGKPVMTDEEEGEVFVKPYHEEQQLFISQFPVEIPKDHYFLGQIFDTPEKQMMYEEFMEDPIIYDRFVKMCEYRNIPIPEGANDTASLPVHKKDGNTGEILISNVVLKVFEQYQFCRNYLNFDKGTAEYDLGKLMMLDPKFCDYMLMVARRKLEGKEPNPENYANELNKAIKRVEKKPALMELYENDLVYDSPEEPVEGSSSTGE